MHRMPVGCTVPGVGLAVAFVAAILLVLQVSADPATGVTFSDSPFTDEGWSVLGARNQALLGRWSTDEWQLFWAQLPFNVAVLGAFEVAGVGIIQARVVAIACAVAATGLLATMLARRLGPGPAAIGGIGLATSALLLYYGRLAILEPMVVLFLVAGFALLFVGWVDRPWIGGVLAGAALALAIGTKPSAAFAVIGMLAGAVALGWGTPGLRWRILAALGSIVAAGAGWLAVVLPQEGLLEVILKIWPQQPLPTSLPELVVRVGRYVRASDGMWILAARLLGGFAVGALLVLRRWGTLPREWRAMAGAAAGWFLLVMLILVLLPYRPNRYVVPLLPPLAVMTALGVAILSDRPGFAGLQRAPIVVGLCLAIAAPGAAAVAEWMSRATHRLPEIQATLLETITDGRPVEGGPAPTMAMRVPVPAIVPRFDVNAGDLYSEHNVGWVLIDPRLNPAWVTQQPAAWAEREQVACFPWGSGEACLFRLP